MRLIGKVHYSREDIALLKICISIFKLQRSAKIRKMLLGIDIERCLVVYAAFELAALSGKFLGVEREVLTTCSLSGNRLEVGHICGAA
jgi:hypothetical protein